MKISKQIKICRKVIKATRMYKKIRKLGYVDKETLKKLRDERDVELKEIMGDYNSATCLGHTVSWKPVSTDRFDSKKFKEDEPELYAKYTKTSVSRRFSLK